MSTTAGRVTVWFALLGLLAPAAGAAGEGKPPEAWRAFDLAETQVQGVTLRYEKSLADSLPAMRTAVGDLVKVEARDVASAAALRGKADAAIDRVNRIVGFSPGEKGRARQRKTLLGFLDAMDKVLRLKQPGRKATLYVVTRKTSKDYLRKGGTLPGFSYDKATDTARYEFRVGTRFGGKAGDDGPTGDVELALPVAADQAGEEVAAVLGEVARARSKASAGVALHELVEITLLHDRLRPTDPYFRWFSDGFANAIAIRLLRETVGEPAAATFAELFAVEKYADLAKEVNLLYWMGVGFAIKTPLESETRLEYARYSYATDVAIGLIDRHGLACVDKILDKACTNPSGNDSRGLLPAVRDVTGEDIVKRLQRYQSFQTKADGLKRYTAVYKAAVAQKDFARAIPALLRIGELQGRLDPALNASVAFMLHRMGHEAAGDRAILDHADLCKRRGLKDAHVALHLTFIQHALRCGKLRRAVPSAEIVLAAQPDCAAALAVRMISLGVAGKTDEAKRIARRVLKLEADPKSPWRRLAGRVLVAPAATRPATTGPTP